VPFTSRLMADLIATAYHEMIQAHASGRIADLGCGRVPLYGMYADHASEVICVDWPSSAHGSEFVDKFADLNLPLDLEPDSFDTLIATDVIEHLHSPSTFFSSAKRVLRPGGKLIVGVPFLYWIHEAPHDYHRYTRFALEKLTTDAGLKVLSLEPIGGAPEVLSDIIVKAISIRPTLAKLIYAITRASLRAKTVRKLSQATRDTMPLGYVLVAAKL